MIIKSNIEISFVFETPKVVVRDSVRSRTPLLFSVRCCGSRGPVAQLVRAADS
jgi:hypothetical protein